jgi:hypothetical protein
MRREKGSGAPSGSDKNHDLEPIGKGPFAGYLRSIPPIPVDDRCRFGQHLNWVKIRMVNSERSQKNASQKFRLFPPLKAEGCPAGPAELLLGLS